MTGRIVLFTPGLHEPGGAQRRARLIATGLARRGWDVRVITRSGSSHWFRIERERHLSVVEVPGFHRRRLGAIMFLTCALPLGLAWGLRARGFLSLQLMSTSTAAGLCSLILRRPFVAMATTTGRLSELDYLRSTRLWPLRRRILARASSLIAQTPEAAAALSSVVSRERVRVVPNPVSIPDHVPSLNGRTRVAFAGRLSAEKNLMTLLDAWRMIAADIPDARLTIAGAGGDFRSNEVELRRRVESDLLLKDTVELPGWLAGAESLLARCDVFVLPSLEEGMSNALLEACALGRVVIASDIPPNRAVLGEDYPLLFEPDDASGLAELIRRAFSDHSLRAEASSHVRARAAAFSTDSVIAQLEDVIDAASSARH